MSIFKRWKGNDFASTWDDTEKTFSVTLNPQGSRGVTGTGISPSGGFSIVNGGHVSVGGTTEVKFDMVYGSRYGQRLRPTEHFVGMLDGSGPLYATITVKSGDQVGLGDFASSDDYEGYEATVSLY